MHRRLRRTIWLSGKNRKDILQSADLASGRTEEYVNKDNIVRLLKELEENERKHNSKMPLPHLISLVISELEMPKDWRPVKLTDEEVDSLIIWGNLPIETALLAKPPTKLFLSEDHELFISDNIGNEKIIPLEFPEYKQQKQRNRQRRRLSITNNFIK